jgi:hypothetical protein
MKDDRSSNLVMSVLRLVGTIVGDVAGFPKGKHILLAFRLRTDVKTSEPPFISTKVRASERLRAGHDASQENSRVGEALCEP